jgi:ribosomal protein S18 acetylase RimI-like enzyme
MDFYEYTSFDDFLTWFTPEHRQDFPMIASKCGSGDRSKDHILKVAKGCETVGIIFFKKRGDGRVIISLFEINSRFRRQGIGTEVFNQLKEKYIGKKPVMLFYAGESGGEAHMFWQSLGFQLPHPRSHGHMLVYNWFGSKSNSMPGVLST